MSAGTWELEPHLVAPSLLGQHLTSELGGARVRLVITEVEAYGGHADPGSHAFRGPTRRNASMFGPIGRAYVYFTYGMHWCTNIVIHPPGLPGAVLVRAGRIDVGLDTARARRPAARSDREIASGPARLSAALGIDGSVDGTDLLDPGSALRLEPSLGRLPPEIGISPRTGVSGPGGQTPWRFFVLDDPSVSRYRPGVPRRRSPISA